MSFAPMQPLRGAQEIRIELDRPDAIYAGNDPVTGRVHLRAGGDDPAVELSVDLQVHVHGKVNRVLVFAEQRLYAGPLRAGDVATYPFTVTVPRRLPQHAGRVFSAEPRIAVVLRGPTPEPPTTVGKKIAYALSGHAMSEARAHARPVAALPLRVVEEARLLTVRPGADADLTPAGCGVPALGCAFALAGVALAGGTVAWWLGWFVLGSRWFATIPGFFAALFVPFGLWALYVGFRSWMAGRKVGTPELTFHPTHDGRGLDVHLKLDEGARPTRVSAALRVSEMATISTGSNKRVARETLIECKGQLDQTGEPGRWRGTLDMAALARVPLPFDLKEAEIVWGLRLTVELPRWPDWRRSMRLDVRREGVPRETLTVKAFPFD